MDLQSVCLDPENAQKDSRASNVQLAFAHVLLLHSAGYGCAILSACQLHMRSRLKGTLEGILGHLTSMEDDRSLC